MKVLKVYNTRQARKDLRAGTKTPLEASIAKWESLYDLMHQISGEALTSCGLCLNHSLCKECPLEDCSAVPEMQIALEAMRNTSAKIKDFVYYLEGRKG